MKNSKLIAIAAAVSLASAGVFAISPAMALPGDELTAVQLETPTFDSLYRTVTSDPLAPGTYIVTPSIKLIPGRYDLDLKFELRTTPGQAENMSADSSDSASISIIQKHTLAPVSDYVGNTIHGDWFDDSGLSNSENVAAQTFRATYDFTGLSRCTNYQVRVVVDQRMSAISNTVIRNTEFDPLTPDPLDPLYLSYPDDADFDGTPDHYDYDSIDFGSELDPSRVPVAQFHNVGDLVGEIADVDGWVNVPQTGGCPSSGGGGGYTAPAPIVVPATPAPQMEQAKTSVYFGGDSAVLSKDALARISSLYSKIPKGAKNIKIIFKGFVSPTVTTSYDKKLAAKRVANVKAQLMKRGITATIVIPTLAVDKKSSTAKARRVDISVTYEMP